MAREKESEIRSWSQEEISYIPVIKSFTAYRQSSERFQNKFAELASVRLSAAISGAVLNGGATVVGFLSFIGAAAFGAYLAHHGEITVGTIVGFIQLLNYIVWPFTDLMPLLGEFQKGKAACERIREIEGIVRENIIEDKREKVNHASDICFQIKDVSFSYGSDMILKDVNLELKGNQFIGVVGPSGCGKSTFMQLLTALYQPVSGAVTLVKCGQKIVGTEMRNYVSYVPQDHLLISGTIAQNIAYGQEQYDMEDVICAAKRAGIHEYICTLSEQYETKVQERGSNFSFGQAQRVAIARALYKDAPVLILDEPTAALDKESKKIIMDTLKHEAKSKLCIMVCHDQAENYLVFDRILSFHNGCIEEIIPGL